MLRLLLNTSLNISKNRILRKTHQTRYPKYAHNSANKDEVVCASQAFFLLNVISAHSTFLRSALRYVRSTTYWKLRDVS